jgi:hypothetical protein
MSLRHEGPSIRNASMRGTYLDEKIPITCYDVRTTSLACYLPHLQSYGFVVSLGPTFANAFNHASDGVHSLAWYLVWGIRRDATCSL